MTCSSSCGPRSSTRNSPPTRCCVAAVITTGSGRPRPARGLLGGPVAVSPAAGGRTAGASARVVGSSGTARRGGARASAPRSGWRSRLHRHAHKPRTVRRRVVARPRLSCSAAVPTRRPLRMPRPLALEGARRLQHEIVAMARADDLHAHRQAGARQADAHRRGRMPREVERDRERADVRPRLRAAPRSRSGTGPARRTDRTARSASAAGRSARRRRRTSARVAARSAASSPKRSGVHLAPRQLDAGHEAAADAGARARRAASSSCAASRNAPSRPQARPASAGRRRSRSTR